MGKTTEQPRPSKRGEPVWELLHNYPPQGHWSEHDFLSLDENILIEYTDGTLEFLPMPTTLHQRIVMTLIRLLASHMADGNPLVLPAPLNLKVADGEYREPDVLCVLDENDPRVGERFWTGADLVVEVVSEGAEARKRDYEDKPPLYAKAGIREYWIVDPIEKQITVLALQGDTYTAHCVAKPGETATSAMLEGFSVAADRVFNLA